ncbi:MAG: ABC transporter ATP-binding protein [Pseudomonadota bacterium]
MIGLLRRIFVADDLRQFASLLILMLIAAALQVVGVAAIFPFMQLVAEPGTSADSAWLRWLDGYVGFASERQMLLAIGSAVFLLFMLSVVVVAITNWRIQRVVWSAAHRLSVRQLELYMRLPYEFFLENNSTELLRRVVADINKVLSDVLLAGTQLVSNAILALSLLILLLLVDPLLSLIAFAGFGSTYMMLHWLRHSTLIRLGRERIDMDHRRYTSFIDAIAGIKAIRATGAGRFFVRRFARVSDLYTRIYPRLELATSIPRHVMEILAFGGILLMVLVFVAVKEDFGAAVPLLSVFALATYRLMPALHIIFEKAARLSNSWPVLNSLAEDLRMDRLMEPAITDSPELLTFADELSFSDVLFAYRQGTQRAVLRGIDITIKKGESIAFVGPTGSGKTTLVDIAVGLLIPTGGALRVDGVPVTLQNAAAWRQCMAYVPQDVFLYDDSVAGNIAFGVAEGARDEVRLRRAAKVAQLDAFVMNELESGFDTLVGERGVRLSGGQRQRLGIARAVYRQPAVLVLDEATSALDTLTEERVINDVRDALPGVTLITIAHRLSTVRGCDRIYVIEHGQIVAAGCYDDLYRSSDLFKRMVDATGSGT